MKIKEKLKKLKGLSREKKLDILVAVSLGVATFLVAWAGWIGALHGGNQATNYTRSNNLASEGNAEYNVATQVYITDLFAWNTIFTLRLDLDAARAKGDTAEAKVIEAKIDKIKHESCTPKLLAAVEKAEAAKSTTSPFEDTEFVSGYFTEANKLLDESQAALEEGKTDNQRADSYQLASVIYSLVLFLLGIISVQKDFASRKLLYVFSICILVFGFIYMLTLPMPTGFDITSFFSTK